MNKETRLILETLKWILYGAETSRHLETEDYKMRNFLGKKIDEVLNPKTEQSELSKEREVALGEDSE